MELGRWEDMEMDCLANIFSRLGLDDLTAAIPFVCKSWYRASADPLCLRVLDFRHLDFDPSSPTAKRLSTHFSLPRFSFSGFLKLALARARGAAVDLSFPSLLPASKEHLTLASNECPRLRNLRISRTETESEEALLLAIGNWTELESIELDSKPSIFPDIAKQIGIHCPQFQGLKLRGSVNKKDAEAIVGYLPNLRWLDLSTCRLGREELLAIVDGCRDLQRLCVMDCVGFEVDEEVKRRGIWIKVFRHEGSVIEDECELEDDRDVTLEQMLMYYDDCYAIWLF